MTTKNKSYFNGELGQRFGFRKYLGVGLCSVALSAFFVVGGHSQQIKADTLDDATENSSTTNQDNSTSQENNTPAQVVQTTNSQMSTDTNSSNQQASSLSSAVENDSSSNNSVANNQNSTQATQNNNNTQNVQNAPAQTPVQSAPVQNNAQTVENVTNNATAPKAPAGTNSRSSASTATSKVNSNDIVNNQNVQANSSNQNIAKTQNTPNYNVKTPAIGKDAAQNTTITESTTNKVQKSANLDTNKLDLTGKQTSNQNITNFIENKVQAVSADAVDDNNITVDSNSIQAHKINQAGDFIDYSYEATVHIADTSKVKDKVIYFLFNPMNGDKYVTDYLTKNDNYTTTATNGIDPKQFGTLQQFNGGYMYSFDPTRNPFSTDLHFTFNWQEKPDSRQLLNSTDNGGLYLVQGGRGTVTTRTGRLDNDINIGLGTGVDQNAKTINNYKSLYQGSSNLDRTVTVVPSQSGILQQDKQQGANQMVDTRYWYKDHDGKEYVTPVDFELSTFIPLSKHVGNEFTLDISQAINPKLFDYVIGDHNASGGALNLTNHDEQNTQLTDYLQKVLPQYAFTSTTVNATIKNQLPNSEYGTGVSYGGATVDPSRVHVTVTDLRSTNDRINKKIHVKVDGDRIQWGVLSNSQNTLMVGPSLISGQVKPNVDVSLPNDINSYEDDIAHKDNNGAYSGYEVKDPELRTWLENDNGVSYLMTSPTASGSTATYDQGQYPGTADLMTAAGNLGNKYDTNKTGTFPQYAKWVFEPTLMRVVDTVPDNAIEAQKAHTLYNDSIKIIYVDATNRTNNTDFSKLPVLATEDKISDNSFYQLRTIKQDVDAHQLTQDDSISQVWNRVVPNDYQDHIPFNWQVLEANHGSASLSYDITSSTNGSMTNLDAVVYIPLVHKTQNINNAKTKHAAYTVQINYPSGFNKTRPINIVYTVDASKSGVQDMVTGDIQYSKWFGTISRQLTDSDGTVHDATNDKFGMDGSTTFSSINPTITFLDELTNVQDILTPVPDKASQNGVNINIYTNSKDITAIYGQSGIGFAPDTKDISSWIDKVQNTTFVINLTPKKFTNKVHFVDVDPSGDRKDLSEDDFTIPATDVGGTAHFTTKLPDNYELAKGSALPTEYKFEPTLNGNKYEMNPTPLIVNVVHKTEKVPQDDSNHRVISRTVTIQHPDGTNRQVVQSVTYDKDVVKDLVTGKTTTQKDWYISKGTNNFAEVNGDPVSGYQPDNHANSITVSQDSIGDNAPKNVTITYSPTEQKFAIDYVSNIDKKTLVATTPVNGKYGQNVSLTYKAPDKWEIVPSQNLPTNRTLTNGNNPDVTVYIRHKLDDITSKSKDANVTITRDVKIIDPNGQTDPASTVQSVTFHRQVRQDEVTGEIIYGNWDRNEDHFVAINTPSFAGYAPSGSVLAQRVTPTDSSSKLRITYSPLDQNVTINYIDVKTGTPIGSHTVSGKTDQKETIDASQYVPEHWVLVPNQNTKFDYTLQANDHKIFSFQVEHKLDPRPDDNGRTKTITRTINITDPDGKKTSQKQTATFTRDANFDEVENKVVYGAWTPETDKLSAVDVPVIQGYTQSANVPEWIVTPDDKDKVIDITYIAGARTNYYHFIDDDRKPNDPDISQQHYEFSGKPGQTVSLTNIIVPTHYQLAKGQQLPTNYTFVDRDNKPIDIHVVHTWSPDTDSNLDTTRAITRTISITNPDGKTTTEQQSVIFTRPATKDDVNGEVKYGDWSNKGHQTMPGLDAPAISGYTPTGSIDPVDVMPDSHPKDIHISYTANPQSSDYHFVDDDEQGALVGEKHAINGKTDQTINLRITVPTNYDLAKGQTIPTTYAFKADKNDPIVIHLVHKHDLNPKDATDTTRTITRTINTTTPDNVKSSQTQQVVFTRSADKDLVTSKITYGDWTSNKDSFDAVTVAPITGYTSQVDGKDASQVASITVKPDDKDITVNVTYNPSEQSNSWYFVDDDENGKQVGDTHNFTGKTKQTVVLNIKVPVNYVANGTIPTSYTFTANGNKPIVVHLKHEFDNNPQGADTSRTITREIDTTTPDGKQTSQTQTVTFTRGAKKDKATGEITYGNWDQPTKAFDQVPLKQIDGYVSLVDGNPNTVVPSESVTPDSKSSKVTVTYKVQTGQQTIIYVDPKGDEVTRQIIPGNVNSKESFTPSIPDGWKPVDQIPSEVIIKSHDDPLKYIIDHQHKTIYPDKPVTPGSLIDGTKTKTYPKGLEHDDLNKTVTQIINITAPNNTTSQHIQAISFTRQADLDVVTGEITYSPWKSVKDDKFVDDPIKQYDGYVSQIDGQDGKTVLGHTVDPNKENGEEVINVTFRKTIDTVNVSHLHPVKPGDLLPGTDVKAPEGVDQDDLNKTIVREIDVIKPDGNMNKTLQKVVMWRDASINLNTMIITYTNWHIDGTDHFDEFKAPKINGYKATPWVVPEVFVNEFTKNSKVVITYSKVEVPHVDNNNNNTNVNDNNGGYVPTPSQPTWSVNDNAGFSKDNSSSITIRVTNDNDVDGDDLPLLRNTRRNNRHYNGRRYNNGNYGNNGSDYNYSNGYNAGYANNNSANDFVTTTASVTSASDIASRAIGVVNGVNNNANTSAQTLPQTGSMSNTAVIALGLVMASLSLGMAIPKKRRN